MVVGYKGVRMLLQDSKTWF